MTDDFQSIMAKGEDAMSEEDQKKAGLAASGSIRQDHKEFIERCIQLIDSGEIDLMVPTSCLNTEVYEALDEEWKDKTDIALTNIIDQLRLIAEFWKSKNTPDESPQLDTMVEQLWQMKQRIEEHHDVFKF